MQTTLLGFGIAIILAVVTALVGPFFVDWTLHRAHFETYASRLIGAPVGIEGRIDVRLLPAPTLSFRAVSIGEADSPTLQLRELDLELELAALFRGELRAHEMRLVGPEVSLGIDAQGRLDGSAAPAIGGDALSIERLSIVGGRIHLADARTGTQRTLEDVRFSGEVRSFSGPFKGEGSFTSDGEQFGYRLNAGRMSEDRSLRLRAGLEPSTKLPSIEVDGAVNLSGGLPRFEGAVTLLRPALAGGLRGSGATDVWRATTKLKATTQSATLEQIDVQFGPEERAVKLTGAAQIQLGAQPRVDGVLSARQVDVDRMLALPDATRRLPAVALAALVDMFGGRLPVEVPGRLGVGVDALTLGATTLQTVRADLVSADGRGWTLEELQFRAPGATQVHASGELTLRSGALAFNGAASVEAIESRALISWLTGESAPGISGPLELRGHVKVHDGDVAIEQLKASYDRRALEGRLAYAAPRAGAPGRIDAALKIDGVDGDATWAALQPLVARLGPDRDLHGSLALEIGALRMLDLDGRDIVVKADIDGGGWHLRQVSAGDLGGAALRLSGDLQGSLLAPDGALNLEIDGERPEGLLAALVRAAPQWQPVLAHAAPQLSPLKLKVQVAAKPAGAADAPARALQVSVAGRTGALYVKLKGNAQGNLADLEQVAWDADAQIEADNSRALARLLAADRFIAVGKDFGRINLTLAGRGRDEVAAEAKVLAEGIEANGKGSLRLFGERPVAGGFQVELAAADVSPAGRFLAGSVAAPLPAMLSGSVAIDGERLSWSEVKGTVGRSTVSGEGALETGGLMRLDAAVKVDSLDLQAAVPPMFGVQAAKRTKDASAWSPEPFAPRSAALAGEIRVHADRVKLTPTLAGESFSTVLRWRGNEFSADDITTMVANGRALGQVTMRGGADGLQTMQLNVDLTGADASAIIPSNSRAPIEGTLALRLSAEGNGRTPASLLGSLAGTGTVSLENAHFVGLDPRLFDNVAGAVDRGTAIDPAKIRELVGASLGSGQLSVPRIDGSFTLAAGQIRLGNIVAQGRGAELAMTGNLDLTEGLLDAKLTFARAGPVEVASAGRPGANLAIRGPLDNPQMSIDASGLANWLTMRAIEREAKRLESLEAEKAALEAKAAQERAAQDKAAREKAAQEAKAAQEKAAQEKAAQEKAARERAAEEKAAQEAKAQELKAQEQKAQAERRSAEEARAAQARAAREAAAKNDAKNEAKNEAAPNGGNGAQGPTGSVRSVAGGQAQDAFSLASRPNEAGSEPAKDATPVPNLKRVPLPPERRALAPGANGAGEAKRAPSIVSEEKRAPSIANDEQKPAPRRKPAAPARGDPPSFLPLDVRPESATNTRRGTRKPERAESASDASQAIDRLFGIRR